MIVCASGWIFGGLVFMFPSLYQIGLHSFALFGLYTCATDERIHRFVLAQLKKNFPNLF